MKDRLCLVFEGREGAGPWQMSRGDVSHILASIPSIRVNTVPRGIYDEFYFPGQVYVHTVGTSNRSALQLGRLLKLEKLPEVCLHAAAFAEL